MAAAVDAHLAGGWAAWPGARSRPFCEPVQRQRDPDQPDADLCRHPAARLSGARAVARSGRLQFPGDAAVQRLPGCCRCWSRRPGSIWLCRLRCVRRGHRLGVHDPRTFHRLQGLGRSGQAPAAAALCRLQPQGRGAPELSDRRRGWRGWRASPRVAGPSGSCNAIVSPGYGFAAIIVAFLGRLHPSASCSPACSWR